jgi:hypothetical protein
MPTFYPAAVYETDKKPSGITVPLLDEEDYIKSKHLPFETMAKF